MATLKERKKEARKAKRTKNKEKQEKKERKKKKIIQSSPKIPNPLTTSETKSTKPNSKIPTKVTHKYPKPVIISPKIK